MRHQSRKGHQLRVQMLVLASLFGFCERAGAVVLFNASFEQPVLPGGFVNDPTPADQGASKNDSPWLFTGAAGIAASNADFGRLAAPKAPLGNQMGFVDQGGNFQQLLNFPAAGQYVLSYQEAGIGIYSVLLDGVPIVASHLAPADFAPVAASFNVSAGLHTLNFQDTDPRQIVGPLPAFIDAVAVVPEPTGTILTLLASVCLLRRRA